MAGDLPGGSYPLTYSPRKALGLNGNTVQGNLSYRSNLYDWALAGGITDAAGALTSGDATVVSIPVEYGDEFTYVQVQVGATAASTPTHSWAQLYSGVATTAVALGTQSTDGGTTAIPTKTSLIFTLGSKVIITPTNAPFGYIYVAVSVTASTVPSLSSAAYAAAVQYARATNAPPFFAGTYSSALGATAPASITLASVTAQGSVPEVYLY